MYEITILVRDSAGNVIYNADGIPKVKTHRDTSGYGIWEFWNRNGTHLRKKVKAAQAKDAQSLLDQVNTVYADKVVKQKRKVEEEDEGI